MEAGYEEARESQKPKADDETLRSLVLFKGTNGAPGITTNGAIGRYERGSSHRYERSILTTSNKKLLGAPGHTTRSKKLLGTRASLLGARTLLGAFLLLVTTISSTGLTRAKRFTSPSSTTLLWWMVVHHRGQVAIEGFYDEFMEMAAKVSEGVSTSTLEVGEEIGPGLSGTCHGAFACDIYLT